MNRRDWQLIWSYQDQQATAHPHDLTLESVFVKFFFHASPICHFPCSIHRTSGQHWCFPVSITAFYRWSPKKFPCVWKTFPDQRRSTNCDGALLCSCQWPFQTGYQPLKQGCTTAFRTITIPVPCCKTKQVWRENHNENGFSSLSGWFKLSLRHSDRAQLFGFVLNNHVQLQMQQTPKQIQCMIKFLLPIAHGTQAKHHHIHWTNTTQIHVLSTFSVSVDV